MTKKELQRLHSQARLELASTSSAACGSWPTAFPAFASRRSWIRAAGARRISRDDLRLRRGTAATSCFSRLEMLITPITPRRCWNWPPKARSATARSSAARNISVSPSPHMPVFANLIDLWVLEYAERKPRAAGRRE